MWLFHVWNMILHITGDINFMFHSMRKYGPHKHITGLLVHSHITLPYMFMHVQKQESYEWYHIL